jgi:hypothetical protein
MPRGNRVEFRWNKLVENSTPVCSTPTFAAAAWLWYTQESNTYLANENGA